MKSKGQRAAVTTGLMGLCLLFCLAVSVSVVRRCEAAFYDRAAAVASVFPDKASDVMAALKIPSAADLLAGRNILSAYGYNGQLLDARFIAAEIIGASLLYLLCFFIIAALALAAGRRREARRIADLVQYLRQVENGVYPVLPRSGEDKFSHLEDELYKTVSALRESREMAAHGKENLAVNLADISHQLKTPLTGVSLMGELLLNSLTDKKQRQAAETIISQNSRMTDLVSSLLTLSKLDAGVLPLNRKPVSAKDVISSAVQAVDPLLKQKRQNLVIQGDSDSVLFCDFGWTAEAFGNLIKNCSEHSPEGSQITAAAEQNPIYTQITIEDEGPGFSPEDIPHLFERFYRGKQAVRESIGIGLALAKSIVERQGGELYAENSKDCSARYVIRFYEHAPEENNEYMRSLTPNC